MINRLLYPLAKRNIEKDPVLAQVVVACKTTSTPCLSACALHAHPSGAIDVEKAQIAYQNKRSTCNDSATMLHHSAPSVVPCLAPPNTHGRLQEAPFADAGKADALSTSQNTRKRCRHNNSALPPPTTQLAHLAPEPHAVQPHMP